MEKAWRVSANASQGQQYEGNMGTMLLSICYQAALTEQKNDSQRIAVSRCLVLSTRARTRTGTPLRALDFEPRRRVLLKRWDGNWNALQVLSYVDETGVGAFTSYCTWIGLAWPMLSPICPHFRSRPTRGQTPDTRRSVLSSSRPYPWSPPWTGRREVRATSTRIRLSV